MGEDEGKNNQESDGEPEEDEKERRDRELIELLNELRVVLPGVQVLFGFLLIAPLSNGYTSLTNLQKNVYFAAFLCAMAATILLIAPSTYHRIQFRRGDKERLLRTANWMVLWGTAFLGASLASAVYVIADIMFSIPAALALSAAGLIALAFFWYVLPVYRRISERQAEEAKRARR
jgi:hypothetical protein